MNQTEHVLWASDWAWSVPLIILTVVIHVLGLGLFDQTAVPSLDRSLNRRRPIGAFIVLMGVTMLVVTVLHALEATIWAAAYRLLEALPDVRRAMLYSLSAMTTYGHANLYLAEQWQLMGAIEALNGIILFGLTTAFLFSMIVRVWPVGARELHRESTGS
jgi:hypothetical protein